MTPEEKAEELYQKFYNNYGYYGMPADAIIHSKQSALIAVDEILNSLDSETIIYSSDYCFEENKYWFQVKEEIEKL
jgi:predicted TIM-barrel fold metal-dependent hydrolase